MVDVRQFKSLWLGPLIVGRPAEQNLFPINHFQLELIAVAD